MPFPALREGDTLAGEALGEVLSAPSDSGLSPGDLVLHVRGWRDYAAVSIAQCRKLGHELPDPIAHLGHGWTAYAALTRGVQIRPGDTVFVSSGAGAIGAMAGQIARLLGAGRVIGSTSSSGRRRDWFPSSVMMRPCFVARDPSRINWRRPHPKVWMSSSTMSAATSCKPASPTRAKARGS